MCTVFRRMYGTEKGGPCVYIHSLYAYQYLDLCTVCMHNLYARIHILSVCTLSVRRNVQLPWLHCVFDILGLLMFL